MLIQPLVLAVGSVATTVLNGHNQFLLPALSIVSHNLALITGIAAARIVPEVGIYGPTASVVGGAVLQVLILIPGRRAGRERVRPVWELGDPGLS